MALTYPEIAWVVSSLQGLLAGAVLRKCHDSEAGVYLRLWQPGAGESLLLLALNEGATRLHLVAERPAASGPPSAFVGLLRKHLIGARLRSLEVAPDDRRVSLVFVSSHGEWSLVHELVPRRGALYLLDGAAKVLGGLGAGRRHQVGEAYRAPAVEAGRVRGQRHRFISQADAGEVASAVIAAAYAAVGGDQMLAERRAELSRGLRREGKRAERLREALERDAARAREAQRFKAYGDLLSAHFSMLVKGQAQIALPCFERPEEDVHIALDPARSPRENISHYYRQYKRMSGALAQIELRLAQAVERATRLAQSLAAVEAAGEVEALERCAAEIAALGLRAPVGGAGERGQRGRGEQRPKLPYRIATTAQGLAIWIGRSARDNDLLTFRHAKGEDLWFHAAGYAGSHVVLRVVNKRPPDSTSVMDAALLALHFSQSPRAAEFLEVHTTSCKYVRRARGSGPGAVQLAGAKVLRVQVDRARLARLLETLG